MFFTNKHVVVAMIVTPILAILGWFAVDFFVAEQALPPETGRSYELLEKPSCRWESGECGLKNGNFEIDLKPTFLANDSIEIHLDSSFPLEGAKLALITDVADDSKPVSMHNKDFSHTRWYLRLEKPLTENSRIRLAVKQNGSFYYADASTTFIVAK